MVSAKALKVVLNLCKEPRLANEALWILGKMNEFVLQADTTAYNVVIRLFCEKGDMAMAEELMNEMGLSDIFPDMISYVTMIKGFCNVGRLEDACGLVKFMRGLGCVPMLWCIQSFLMNVGVWRGHWSCWVRWRKKLEIAVLMLLHIHL